MVAMKRMQIEKNAALTVTGLPIFDLLNYQYFVDGLETLVQQRKTKHISLMYKIINVLSNDVRTRKTLPQFKRKVRSK